MDLFREMAPIFHWNLTKNRWRHFRGNRNSLGAHLKVLYAWSWSVQVPRGRTCNGAVLTSCASDSALLISHLLLTALITQRSNLISKSLLQKFCLLFCLLYSIFCIFQMLLPASSNCKPSYCNRSISNFNSGLQHNFKTSSHLSNIQSKTEFHLRHIQTFP